MNTIAIIAGCHGVGKTSFLGALSGMDLYLGEIIDEDKILLEFGGDAILRDRIVSERIRDCIEWELSLTFKTALSLPLDKLKEELEYAREQQFKIDLCYIGIDSLEESIARVNNRMEKGGRCVPAGEIAGNYAHRWDSLKEIIPYCTGEISLYDNNNGFEKVGEYKHGAFIRSSDFLPEWMNELLHS